MNLKRESRRIDYDMMCKTKIAMGNGIPKGTTLGCLIGKQRLS